MTRVAEILFLLIVASPAYPMFRALRVAARARRARLNMEEEWRRQFAVGATSKRLDEWTEDHAFHVGERGKEVRHTRGE